MCIKLFLNSKLSWEWSSHILCSYYIQLQEKEESRKKIDTVDGPLQSAVARWASLLLPCAMHIVVEVVKIYLLTCSTMYVQHKANLWIKDFHCPIYSSSHVYYGLGNQLKTYSMVTICVYTNIQTQYMYLHITCVYIDVRIHTITS